MAVLLDRNNISTGGGGSVSQDAINSAVEQYISEHGSGTTATEKAEIAKIANKVDKVTGKGLSTNDYSDAEKAQVAQNKADLTELGSKVGQIDTALATILGTSETE